MSYPKSAVPPILASLRPEAGFGKKNLMTKAANSAPLVPYGQSTDGKGCHLDLPATEVCSKSE